MKALNFLLFHFQAISILIALVQHCNGQLTNGMKVGTVNFQPMLSCKVGTTMTFQQLVDEEASDNDNDNELSFSGYDIEIMRRISSNAGLDLTQLYLTCYTNEDALLAAIKTSAVDVGIGGIQIDYLTMKQGFKMSLPLYTGGLKMAVRTQEDNTIWRFFYPFHWSLWIVIFFTTLIVSVLTWLFEDSATFRCSRKDLQSQQLLQSHKEEQKENNNNNINAQFQSVQITSSVNNNQLNLANSQQVYGIGSPLNHPQMRNGQQNPLYGMDAISGNIGYHPSEEFTKEEIQNALGQNIGNNSNSEKRHSHPLANYLEMLWQSFSSLFFASSIRLQTFSARMVFLGFWFIVVVVSVTYVSNLTTIISSRVVQAQLPTYGDVIASSKATIFTFDPYVTRYTPGTSKFQGKIKQYPKSKSGLSQLISEFLSNDIENYEYNVLLLDSPIVYYVHSTYPCSTSVILETLNNFNYGLISYNSALISSFNTLLYNFIDDPYWLYLIATYLNQTPQEHFCFTKKSHIDPPKINGLWIILAVFVALAVLIDRLEAYYKKIKQQKQANLGNSKISTQTNGTNLVTSVVPNASNLTNKKGIEQHSPLNFKSALGNTNGQANNTNSHRQPLTQQKKDTNNILNNFATNGSLIIQNNNSSGNPSNFANNITNNVTNSAIMQSNLMITNNNSNNMEVHSQENLKEIEDQSSDSDFLLVSDYIHIPSSNVHLLAQEEIVQQINSIETIMKRRFNNVEENIVRVLKKLQNGKNKNVKTIVDIDDVKNDKQDNSKQQSFSRLG